MKKIILPIVAMSAIASTALAEKSVQTQLDELKIKLNALQAQLIKVKKHDAHDNVKFSADFRTAYNIVDYKLAEDGKQSANGILTNKFILKMSAQPLENLIFHGSLGAYKAFGNNSSFAVNPYQSMDWYGTNSPSDSKLKLREAYFLYKKGFFAASLGRRPSLDGFLVNYREDNRYAQSPTGHNINMEFDGASFMLDLDKLTPVAGSYLKLCLGRGNSRADARYPTFDMFMGTRTTKQMIDPALPYNKKTKFDSPNMDLAGLIAQVYDDGQYKVVANYFQAWNLMGANIERISDAKPAVDAGITAGQTAYGKAMANGATKEEAKMAAKQAAGQAYMGKAAKHEYKIAMTDVGNMSGGSLGLQVSGIGDGISDFLDDMNVFVSVAFSKTDPKGKHNTMAAYMQTDMKNIENGIAGGKKDAKAPKVKEMLGSSDSELGTSYYVGVNFPVYFSGDKLGLEYNHGDKYWRSFTYGEDTLVGSKLATRGNAYEIFYNVPLMGKNLTAQVRFTHIDYDYTGSNMFFGSTGTPMSKSDAKSMGMDFLESANEARFSIRYRY